jgi:2-iminobutanoate/2-iminopropanoate deaminase
MKQRQVIQSEKAPAAIGPYVQAVKCRGSFVFISGQIPLDAAGTLIPGGIEAQAEQVFKNVLAIAEAAGGSGADIVKNGIFLKNMQDFTRVNEIYSRFFSEHPPARFCVEVSHLPKDVLIEMDAVLCLDD